MFAISAQKICWWVGILLSYSIIKIWHTFGNGQLLYCIISLSKFLGVLERIFTLEGTLEVENLFFLTLHCKNWWRTKVHNKVLDYFLQLCLLCLTKYFYKIFKEWKMAICFRHGNLEIILIINYCKKEITNNMLVISTLSMYFQSSENLIYAKQVQSTLFWIFKLLLHINNRQLVHTYIHIMLQD